MGNHGLDRKLSSGATIANAIAMSPIIIQALQTRRPLRVLSDEVAEKTAQQLEAYPEQDERHFSELKSILDRQGFDYAD